jgi:hypothetical protein
MKIALLVVTRPGVLWSLAAMAWLCGCYAAHEVPGDDGSDGVILADDGNQANGSTDLSDLSGGWQGIAGQGEPGGGEEAYGGRPAPIGVAATPADQPDPETGVQPAGGQPAGGQSVPDSGSASTPVPVSTPGIPDPETDRPTSRACPYPPRKGVIENWLESGEELDFDSLLGVRGTGLVGWWSVASLDSFTGPDSGYFYAAGEQDEIAEAGYTNILAIRDTSNLAFDEWVTGDMVVGGIGVLHNPVTGCYAALRFDDFYFPRDSDQRLYEAAATVSWFFAGGSDDFYIFRIP